MTTPNVDDHLAGVATAIYPKRGGIADDEVAVELTRLSVETGYIRRDVDKLVGLLEGMAHPETGLYTRLTRIESKLQHVPTHWGVAGILGGLLVLVAALGALLGPMVERALGGTKAPPTASDRNRAS